MNEQQKKTVQAVAGQDFIRGVWAELKRVTWPTRDEWIAATLMTIGLVVSIGVFTFALDQLFGWLFGLIHPAAG